MTRTRKTILQLGLILLFSLCLLEVGMRAFGRGILAVQEIGNEIRSEDSTAVRILTVGESTTADYFSTGSRNSWPRQLEAKLQDKGIKARVYNVARLATTSAAILERLPEQLDHFKPHIVISMMGINDANTLLFRDQFWWDNLRVFKLYRTLASRLKHDELPSKNFSDPEATRAILKGLQNADIGPTLSLIEQQIKALNDSERSQYFCFLAKSSFKYQFSNQTQIELLERALKARFQGGPLLLTLSDLLVPEGKAETCFNLASQFVSRGWIGAEKLIERSHRVLHKLLADRKILHIEMQYATWPIGKLKNYFAGESGKIEKDFQDIIFVENEGNFANALQKFPYEKIFLDRFGGTFGHTTDLGHSIYAEAAIPAVLEAINPAD